jgi:predicted ribosomally synthesized peptide with SipW-like signal peptide
MRVPLPVKLLISFAIVGLAASIAGLATFASFTSSTSAQTQSLTSGTVSIALGTANRLTIGASNLVPGDTMQRAVDITNNGSAGTSSVGTITLTTGGSGVLLDTDATNGLQMVIDRCSMAWTESGPPYAYTCGGTTSTVLASRAVVGTNIALSNMASVSAGSTDHLRVTLTLPAGAGNSFQGLSDTLNYTFTANQRTAGNQ